MDFGPGTASPKGNVGPPLGFPVLPSSLLLTPPQLLILNLEGVAGSDPGRGGRGEHIWTWVVARLTCLNSASLLALPPRNFGKPLLFVPLALKMFRGQNKPCCALGGWAK